MIVEGVERLIAEDGFSEGRESWKTESAEEREKGRKYDEFEAILGVR